MTPFKEMLEKEKIEGIKSIKVEGSRESPSEDTEYNCWEALVEDSEGDFDIPFIIKTEESISIKALGEFFWNRYGKLFALAYLNKDFVDDWDNVFVAAKSVRESEASFCEKDAMNALDFLDAIDCLGKSEIEKRLEELK